MGIIPWRPSVRVLSSVRTHVVEPWVRDYLRDRIPGYLRRVVRKEGCEAARKRTKTQGA